MANPFWKVRFDVTGLDTTIKNLGGLTPRIRSAAKDALEEEGTRIVWHSRTYVPVDTGELRASARVGTRVVGHRITAAITYGGPAGTGNVGMTNSREVKYALAVHEIPPPPAVSPGGRSAKHKPPTQWKYLERAMLETRKGLPQRLAARLRRKLV